MESNSNFTITDFSVDKTTQELTSVEINGKTFSLEPTPSPTGVSKLYAWTYVDGEYINKSIYTITETPSSDDKVLGIHAAKDASLGMDTSYLTFPNSIQSVGTNSITYGNKVYERNSEKDITLVS